MPKKTLTTAIILAILAGLGIFGYHMGTKWYNNKYGENYRWDLSNNLTIIEYNNGHIGVFNNATQQITGTYDYVFITSSYDDNKNKRSVFVVVKDDLRGYISAETGEVIFEPQFLHAWIDDTESNLAACVNKNGKLGFVNVKTKQTIIPFEFDYSEYYDYVFHNGLCIMTKIEHDANEDSEMKKQGIIDTKGNVVLPYIYTDIDFLDGGYIQVYNNGKYGLLDRLYNTVFPVEYDDLELYGDFTVKVGCDEKYGYFERLPDGKYKMVLPIMYDYIGFDSQGIVAVKDGVQKLFDDTGKKLLSNFYLDNIVPLYEVTDEVYTIDEDGDFIKTQETRTKSIYSKFYTVAGYYGVVDHNFKLIIPAKYSSIKYIGNGFFKCAKYNYGSDYEEIYDDNHENNFETDVVILNSKGEFVGKK